MMGLEFEPKTFFHSRDDSKRVREIPVERTSKIYEHLLERKMGNRTESKDCSSRLEGRLYLPWLEEKMRI